MRKSKKKNLIIYGVGKFAEYAAYVFEKDSTYKVKGFCIEQEYLDKTPGLSKEILSFEKVAEEFSRENYALFIAIGNNLIRKYIYTKAKNKGFSLATYVSSKAAYWDNLMIGDNSFVSEGNILQAFTTIGSNSILFNNQIGHHCRIGDNTLVSVSILGGNVKIDNDSYIGMGSVIKQNIKIAEKNIIGMGCIIERNTEPESVYSHSGTKKRDVSYNQVLDRFLK